MKKKFRPGIIELLQRAVRDFSNRHIVWYNDLDNQNMTMDYLHALQKIKEKNSKIVFDTYYYPLAKAEILRSDNYLATEDTVKDKAAAMMLKDKADGVLDDFWKFN